MSFIPSILFTYSNSEKQEKLNEAEKNYLQKFNGFYRKKMEYVTGGLAGVFAGCFTNPLDVVKTRLQLQGELKARGKHVVHYKNTLHAVYVIAKTEGIVSLQKGLVPALMFQLSLNGTRLGTFGTLEEWGWTKNSIGEVSLLKTAAISGVAGCIGSFMGSPLYLIKTQRQSRASNEIAVGHQHDQKTLYKALSDIYKNEGVKGLWRGSVSSLPRIGIGGSVQLSTFSLVREFLEKHKVLTYEKSLWNTFAASMCCGVVVAFVMTPFDVVQTRLYNQGLDKHGKGLLYSGIIDCFVKTWTSEGFHGFFKGLGPCYLRIGPHSLLTLVFWDILNQFLIH